MYNSGNSDDFASLCNHYHSQDAEHFHYLQNIPISFADHAFSFLDPDYHCPALVTRDSLSLCEWNHTWTLVSDLFYPI